MGANKFWSTNISRKRDDRRIWLLYRGGLTFSATVKKTHLENYRLDHPRPALPERQPTPPPPPPAPPHEATPSPKRLPRPGKPKAPKPAARMTLNSLLVGVTNINKRRRIIREHAKRNKQNTGSETESEFEEPKPKHGKLNIKDFVIRWRKPKKKEFSNVPYVNIKTIHRVNKTRTSKQSMQIFILNASIAQRHTRSSMENGNTKKIISI